MSLWVRILIAVAAFFVLPVVFWLIGAYIWNWAYYEPLEGMPSTDPRGRGIEAAVDFLGVGRFILLLFSAIGAALAFLSTYKENRNAEFFITGIMFLIFASVTGANYTRLDAIFTRDSQAILNIALVGSTVGVVVVLQR